MEHKVGTSTNFTSKHFIEHIENKSINYAFHYYMYSYTLVYALFLGSLEGHLLHVTEQNYI